MLANEISFVSYPAWHLARSGCYCSLVVAKWSWHIHTSLTCKEMCDRRPGVVGFIHKLCWFLSDSLQLSSSDHPEQAVPAETQNSQNRSKFHSSWLDQLRLLTSPVARAVGCIGWPDFSHILPPPDLRLWSASVESHGFLKGKWEQLGKEKRNGCYWSQHQELTQVASSWNLMQSDQVPAGVISMREEAVIFLVRLHLGVIFHSGT